MASLITASWNPLMEWLRRLAAVREHLSGDARNAVYLFTASAIAGDYTLRVCQSRTSTDRSPRRRAIARCWIPTSAVQTCPVRAKPTDGWNGFSRKSANCLSVSERISAGSLR